MQKDFRMVNSTGITAQVVKKVGNLSTSFQTENAETEIVNYCVLTGMQSFQTAVKREVN